MNKAVTLLEIMVTIIIIGIMAGLAMPLFPRAMENTRAKEAVAGLQQIRTGERIYRVEENTYWGPSVGSGISEIQNINDALRVNLDIRPNRSWDYDIAVVGTTSFTATAERIDGGHVGKTIVFDEDGLDQASSTWTLPISE